MKKSLLLAKRLAVVCVLIFSQLIFIQSSQATTPTYIAEITVTGFSSPTWITRGGGFIWVSQSLAINKVDEVSGTIVSSYSLIDTPQEIVYDGRDVFALLANSKIAKIEVSSNTVSYTTTPACDIATPSNSIAANASAVIVACYSSGKVARYQNSNLTELERVTLASAGRVVIANNLAYITQFGGTFKTWKYSLNSLEGPTGITTNFFTNKFHRLTSDSNYVWIVSAANAQPIKVVRISLADDSVSYITLSSYNVSSNIYQGVTSDGSTVFISSSTSNVVIAIDIATSSASTALNLAAAPSGIRAVTNGFWIVEGSNLVKYSSATTPAAPTLNSVTGGDKRVTVAFTVGANNGASITDYEYSLNSGAYISAGTTTSPFTITGLSGRTSYSVTIKARNSVGLGTASSSVSATTTDSALDASDAAAAIAEAARVAAAAQAARQAREQKEITEIMAMIPKLGELTLSLGEVTRSLTSTQCVKGKATKYVKKGAKCPKGFVKK